MKLSAPHLKRYKEIASLLWKYGHSDLASKVAAANTFELQETEPAPGDPQPAQLAADLEAMGPTFVKIGQILAGRPDLIPPPYLEALARLEDQVRPFSYEEAEETILAELGVRVSKAFARFDPNPVAAASLGQVHVATLRNGLVVAVKVQRPGIRRQIADDFEILGEIAAFLDEHTETGARYRFGAVLDEFRGAIQQELNYEREAENLVSVGRNLQEFDRLRVPRPVLDYTSRSVLTMEYIEGSKITALTPLAQMDVPGAELAEQLFQAYLKQVLVDGLFHADPHPGNIFLASDGRLALLDLGMVGHTTPGMQDHLFKVLVAVSEGKGEEAADEAVRMGRKTESFDGHEFKRQVSQLVASIQGQSLRQMEVGRSLLEVSRQARNHGLVVPSELTFLGKTLLQLDEIGRILDPAFDPNASVRRSLGSLTSSRLKRSTSRGSVAAALMEMKDFTAHLPTRLNRIMDAVANAELEVKIKATDAKNVVEGIEKVANRITAGLLITSLVIASALIMRIDTRWHIFGYPGFAMLCFLGAAVGAVVLLGKISGQDRRSRRNRVE